MSKLVPIADGIYCIDAQYIQPEIAAIYLIVDQQQVAIIDTGNNDSVKEILLTLDALGLTTNHVKYIIPTHIHLDHAGGCGELLSQCPNATVLIHPRGIRHMINPERLIAGAKHVYGEEQFNALYGEIKSIDESRITAMDDQSRLTLGDRNLRFIHTIGHAKHHFCIYDESTKCMFTGDNFGISYPVLNTQSKHQQAIVIPTTTPIDYDPIGLKDSLDKLMALKPNKLLLTHFSAIDEIDSAYQQMLYWIKRYAEICKQWQEQAEDDTTSLYQLLLKDTQNYLENHYGITAEAVEKQLFYDLKLNAQGLLYYLKT